MVECGLNLLDVKFRHCAEVVLRLSSALKDTAYTYALCSRPLLRLVAVFLYTFAGTSVEIGAEVAEVPQIRVNELDVKNSDLDNKRRTISKRYWKLCVVVYGGSGLFFFCSWAWICPVLLCEPSVLGCGPVGLVWALCRHLYLSCLWHEFASASLSLTGLSR